MFTTNFRSSLFLTQFIFNCLYSQHYYCVRVMALNYVYVFMHDTLSISELSSYYFCYKGFVQQPSLHPHVRVLCSKYNVQRLQY